MGVTTPALLAFDPTGLPPVPVPAPEGWRLTVDLARFGELEDGTPALAILLDIESEPGAAMDHTLTVAFRDQTGRVILSITRGIASFVPQLTGAPDRAEVFRDLLACP